MSWTVPDPRKRPSTASLSGSTIRKVGQASTGDFSTTALLVSRSVSNELHTSPSEIGFIPASLSTKHCIDRQELLQDSLTSLTNRFYVTRAAVNVFRSSASIDGLGPSTD